MSIFSGLIQKFKDMPYNTRQTLIIFGLIIVLVSIPVTVALVRQNPQFTSRAASTTQFDGTPTTPQAFSTHPDYANFDVQLYDDAHPYVPEPINAQHGTDCSAPPATHLVTDYNNLVYICNNHVMTSFNAGDGYGEVILTPNRILDWTNGPATATFQLSTQVMSGRDWPDFMLSPYVDNVATYYDDTGAFNNFPRSGFWMKELGGFGVSRIVNYVNQGEVCDHDYAHFNEGITPGTNEAAVRQTFRLTISRTHIRVERLASATATQRTYCETDIPDTLDTQGFTTGVVQFGQHSYNPEKCGVDCVPATWHWDEFTLSPSVPFTIIKSDQRIVPTDGTNDYSGPPGVYDVHFLTPSPTNAYLRFTATAESIDISFDGGATYTPARLTSPVDNPHHVGRSYFTSMSAGVQDVKLRINGDTRGGHGVLAHDFSIWSQTTNGGGGTDCTKVADINCDGLVNILDMSILLSKWNTTDPTADINHDGKVSVFDLSILLSKWGS